MKKLLWLLAVPLLIISCNNDNKTSGTGMPVVEITENAGFFPVTSYLKGQIAEIKASGIGPVRIIVRNNTIDSVWLKPEQLDSVFAVFLTPEIDSANMVSFFKESKFHDQTLNSYTFTYEPVKTLPPSMLLKRWDVYVNPQTGNVKRIYIEKSMPDKKEVQLSWQSNTSSRMVLFSTDAAGNTSIEKEEFVKWNFDEE